MIGIRMVNLPAWEKDTGKPVCTRPAFKMAAQVILLRNIREIAAAPYRFNLPEVAAQILPPCRQWLPMQYASHHLPAHAECRCVGNINPSIQARAAAQTFRKAQVRRSWVGHRHSVIRHRSHIGTEANRHTHMLISQQAPKPHRHQFAEAYILFIQHPCV